MSNFKKHIKTVRDHAYITCEGSYGESKYEYRNYHANWKSLNEVACETALMYCLEELGKLDMYSQYAAVADIIKGTKQILNAKTK